MAPTQILTQPKVGPYPTLPVPALSLDIALTAADVANGNFFVIDSSGDILVAWNTDASPHHFTLTSQPDSQGRSGDITSYTIGAGVHSVFLFTQLGWATSGSNNVLISADSAFVKFAILR